MKGSLKLLLVVLVMLNTGVAQSDDTGSGAESDMKIRFIVGKSVAKATLDDNPASRDFIALLPLELTLSDFDSTEKVADLPARLSTQSAPDGMDPEIGDITYYRPWGNLAIFYRDFPYARGLVRLGRVETGMEHLTGKGTIKVRIEKASE